MLWLICVCFPCLFWARPYIIHENSICKNIYRTDIRSVLGHVMINWHLCYRFNMCLFPKFVLGKAIIIIHENSICKSLYRTDIRSVLGHVMINWHLCYRFNMCLFPKFVLGKAIIIIHENSICKSLYRTDIRSVLGHVMINWHLCYRFKPTVVFWLICVCFPYLFWARPYIIHENSIYKSLYRTDIRSVSIVLGHVLIVIFL